MIFCFPRAPTLPIIRGGSAQALTWGPVCTDSPTAPRPSLKYCADSVPRQTELAYFDVFRSWGAVHGGELQRQSYRTTEERVQSPQYRYSWPPYRTCLMQSNQRARHEGRKHVRTRQSTTNKKDVLLFAPTGTTSMSPARLYCRTTAEVDSTTPFGLLELAVDWPTATIMCVRSMIS
jgi:hypothetical protein